MGILWSRAVAVGLLLLAAGCVSRSAVRNMPLDSGQSVTYKAPLEKVKGCCRDALLESGFKWKEEGPADPARTMMIYSRGISTTSAGGVNARIVIEDKKDECVVWVLIMSRLDNRDTESQDAQAAKDVHAKIEKRLK